LGISRRRLINAVIRTGGKQYHVHEGMVVDVATLDAEAGSDVELRDVLLVSDGDKITVGNPTVADAVVIAEVVEHGRGKKVINFKYKAKVRYRRKRGHRQGFTKLAVREIRIGDRPADEAAAPSRRSRRAVTTRPLEGDDPEVDAEDIVQATLETGPEPEPSETPAPSPRRGGRPVDTPPVEGDDAEIDAEDIVRATMGDTAARQDTPVETSQPARRGGRVLETPPVEGDDAEIDAEDIVKASMGDTAPEEESPGESAPPARRRRRGSEGASETQG
jgi:large subunit ribosomal protein L21